MTMAARRMLGPYFTSCRNGSQNSITYFAQEFVCRSFIKASRRVCSNIAKIISLGRLWNVPIVASVSGGLREETGRNLTWDQSIERSIVLVLPGPIHGK